MFFIMVKIDLLIFGYRKLSVSPDDLSLVTSLLLRASIPSRINSDGSLSVRERDFSRIASLFQGRIEFEYSEPLGLLGKWKSLKNKPALIISVAVSAILIMLLSSLVWDVRIEGNEQIPDSEIILQLSQCGLEIGSFWRKTDTAEVENKLLSSYEDISWVNINRRGTVAYVSVIERQGEQTKSEDLHIEYSNIIATADCVIEEVTVKSGIAVVKPGDSVQKGDLLILGALPAEQGGGFCRAEGHIIGRMSDTVSTFVGRNYEKNLSTDRNLYSITLKLFKFSINIFKRYGNLTYKYDIIENEITYSLFGKCRLPFSVMISYTPEYEVTSGEYTDDELCAIAASRLSLETARRLADSELVRIRSFGEFTDDGYTMTSELVFLCEIGRESAFDID